MKFVLDKYYTDNKHAVGDKNCSECQIVHMWRDDEETQYPIICDICNKGLMHAEEGYADSGNGGINITGFYKCDVCGKF